MNRLIVFRSKKGRVSFLVHKRTVTVFAALALLTFAVIVTSIGLGNMSISPVDVFRTMMGQGTAEQEMVIGTLRLPRNYCRRPCRSGSFRFRFDSAGHRPEPAGFSGNCRDYRGRLLCGCRFYYLFGGDGQHQMAPGCRFYGGRARFGRGLFAGMEQRGNADQTGADRNRNFGGHRFAHDADDHPQPDHGCQPGIHLVNGKHLRRIVGTGVHAAPLGGGVDSVGTSVFPKRQRSGIGGRCGERAGRSRSASPLHSAVHQRGAGRFGRGCRRLDRFYRADCAAHRKESRRTDIRRVNSGCGADRQSDAGNCRHGCENGFSSAGYSGGRLDRGGGRAFLYLFAIPEPTSVAYGKSGPRR